jgi:hypothetical protein
MTLRFVRFEVLTSVPMKIPSLLEYDAVSTGTLNDVSDS